MSSVIDQNFLEHVSNILKDYSSFKESIDITIRLPEKTIEIIFNERDIQED